MAKVKQKNTKATGWMPTGPSIDPSELPISERLSNADPVVASSGTVPISQSYVQNPTHTITLDEARRMIENAANNIELDGGNP